MGEYVPDTAKVMATYATVATYKQSPGLARQAAFKVWMTEHDLQIAARAWREGWAVGQADSGSTASNPYESGDDQ